MTSPLCGERNRDRSETKEGLKDKMREGEGIWGGGGPAAGEAEKGGRGERKERSPLSHKPTPLREPAPSPAQPCPASLSCLGTAPEEK